MNKFYNQRIVGLAIFCLLAFAGSQVNAQDIHFSQFYASPLTLNPALTGKVNGNFRIAGIFRSQWGGIPSVNKKPTFGTPSVSFDLPIFVGKKKMDAVGLGAVLVNDYSNGGRYNILRGMISASYIKSLGKDGKHQLSIGLQGGFQQSKTGSFRFEDQYVDGVYDDGTTSFDAGYNNQSKMIPDFQAGLFYNGQIINSLTLFAGFSMFHLFEPKDRFTTGSTSNIARRYVVHGGLEWAMAPKWTLYPGVIFMYQAKASEVNFGTNVGYHFKKEDDGRNSSIFLGAWYRTSDAFIAMIGGEFKGFRAGFSYDVTTSSLKNSNSNGAYEISLIYVGKFSTITDKKTFLFCPRF